VSDEPTAPSTKPPAPAESADQAPAPDVPQRAPGPEPKQPEGQPGKTYFWGTGRRKASVARVRVRPGEGVFKINGRDVDKHFRLDKDRQAIVKPLEATGTTKKVDVFVNVGGGGTTGQAGAIVLGVARALIKCNTDYEAALREGRYLTRDARRVERKKYGQRGARRRFQFSKR